MNIFISRNLYEEVFNKYKTLEYGSITTKAGERLSLRLKRIGEDLQSIIRTMGWPLFILHIFFDMEWH